MYNEVFPPGGWFAAAVGAGWNGAEGEGMDGKFLCEWLKGFERGLEEMDADARSRLLSHCARQCADTGVLQAHLRHFRTVGGDRDEYYRSLSRIGGVRGEVLVPGREYRICFPACACDLHTEGGVNTPLLCECSRQSILYVAKTVWKGCGLRVETEGTVLSGAAECAFRLVFEREPAQDQEAGCAR